MSLGEVDSHMWMQGDATKSFIDSLIFVEFAALFWNLEDYYFETT